ncbi:hypothetical protein NSP_34860 [Nodularia spumigena CCY9414]|nr:hypothetical protein NSP_34860 [Nodularia spumigena CCY9414]
MQGRPPHCLGLIVILSSRTDIQNNSIISLKMRDRTPLV